MQWHSRYFSKKINVTYIVGLSQIFLSVCELTILCKWTFVVLQEVLAQLSFIFLLQSVELALVSIEVVVI